MKIKINSPYLKQKDVEGMFTMPVIVSVIGDFNEAAAKKLYEDCDKAVSTGQTILPILIDSYGGYVDSLVGMLDYFQSLREDGVEIITIACGKVMSCGAYLFSMGDKRYIGQRSRLMYHRLSGGSSGNASDMKSASDEADRLERSVLEEVSKHIGKPKGWLFEQLKERNFADWYLTAKECLSLGVATNIGIPQFTFAVNTEFSYK